MYILIVGGGKVGYYLTKTLVNEGTHEVMLIERNPQKVEIFTVRFGRVVMQGNGDEVATQEHAGAGRADVVIAVAQRFGPMVDRAEHPGHFDDGSPAVIRSPFQSAPGSLRATRH